MSSHKKNNVFIWRVNGNLFTSFMNAKNGVKFTSKQFKLCDGAIWKLNCYPNGFEKDDKGFCSLFLHCCSLPIYSKSIEINYYINFVEIGVIKHLSKSFTKNETSWGYSQIFKNTKLKKLKSKKKLTIKCIIQRTMNIDNLITDNKLYWNIDGKLLQIFKSTVNMESYNSPSFKTKDGSIWYFCCYPNGIYKVDTGFFSLYLHNKSLSNLCKHGIGINYQIKIIELNKTFNFSKTFKNNNNDNSWGNSQIFKHDQLYKLKKLTIICIIQQTMKLYQENINNNHVIWNIDENLLNTLKNAKCDDEVTSPTFKICDTFWNISCFPNGSNQNKGYFSLYLECNQLKKDEKYKYVDYHFECNKFIIDSTRLFQENDSYGTHRAFLNKQLQKMDKLTIKCCIQCAKDVNNNDDDDKKDDVEEEKTDKRINCMQHKKHLDEDEGKHNKSCHEMTEYEAIKQRRIALQKRIKNDIKECNELIEKENKLFYQQYNKKNVLETESATISSGKCLNPLNESIKSYNEFLINNAKYIDELNKYFESIWSEFESKWMEWSVCDIVEWIKYITKGMDLKTINFETIISELEKQDICGKSLNDINDVHQLELFGINDFSVRNHIMNKMIILRNKYKLIDNKNNNDNYKNKNKNDNKKDILSTPEPPKVPFDGYAYLKIHKKSNENDKKSDEWKPGLLLKKQEEKLKAPGFDGFDVHIFDGLLCNKSIIRIDLDDTLKYKHEEIYKLYSNAMPNMDDMKMYKIERNYKQNLNIYQKLLSTMNNKTEGILYHGVSFENIEEIIYNGFIVNGKGTYFVKNAKKAAIKYSKKDKNGYYALLICKVIIGHYGLINSSSTSYQQYDSLVNDLKNPTIFYIDKDNHIQAIPVYIMVFKPKSKVKYKDK